MPATIMDYFWQTFRRFMGLWLRFYAYFTGTVIKAQREKLRNLPKFTLVLLEPGLGLNDLTSEPACFTILPHGKEKSHRDIHHSDLFSLLTRRTVTWSQAEKALWVKPKAVVFTENSQDSSTLILTKWGREGLLPPLHAAYHVLHESGFHQWSFKLSFGIWRVSDQERDVAYNGT